MTMTMTMREKLMMQIMERKRKALEAVNHQVEEFDHYLSSLCILRGLPPPSLSSSQLNKEELISEVLLPRPYANPYTGSHNSFRQRLVPDAVSWGLEDSSFRDVSALNRGVTARDRLSVSPQLPAADAKCALDEFGGAGREVLVRDSHSKSLARIERSKSRKKALKLRNSTKAEKTRSWDLQDVHGSSGQILEARTDALQQEHPSDPRLVEAVRTIDRLCSENDENIGGGTLVEENVGDERSGRSQSSDKMNDSRDGAEKTHSWDLQYVHGSSGQILEVRTDALQQEHHSDPRLVESVRTTDRICSENDENIGGGTLVEENVGDERSGRSQSSDKMNDSRDVAEKTHSWDLQYVHGSSGQILEVRTDALQQEHHSDPRLVESVRTTDRICSENDENIGGGTLVEENIGDERSGRSQSSDKMNDSRDGAEKTHSWDLQYVNGSSGQILEVCTDALQQEHHSDPRLVESVRTTDRICSENDENIGGGTLVEENIGDERRGRSHSSDIMNDSQDGAENSSDLPYISKEDGDREMIYRLKHQSGCSDAVCETVDHFSAVAGASCAAEDIAGGDCNKKSSNTNSGLSRKSFGQTSGGEKGNLDIDDACSGDKDSIRPKFSTDKSSQQPDNVNQLGGWAKPSHIVPCGSNGARMMTKDISTEGCDVVPEIITRSRSSAQQSDSTREHSKLDPSSSYGKEECIDNVEHLSHHCDDSRNKCSSGDLNRNKSSSVLRGSKRRNASYEDELERPNSFHQQHSSAGAPLIGNRTCCVSLEANAGKLWQAPSQSLVGGRHGYQGAFVSDSKVSLQFDSRNNGESENCDAVQAVTRIDSERLVENEVTCDTNLIGSCLGVEMVETKSTTDSDVLVNPKELNFDDEEERTLMEMGDSIVNNSQDKPDLWIEDAFPEEEQLSRDIDKEDKASSENEVANCDISLEPATMKKADQHDTNLCVSAYPTLGSHSLDSLHQGSQIKIINSNEPQLGSPILKTNQCHCRDPAVDANRLDHGKGHVKCEDQNDDQPTIELEVLLPAEQLEQVGTYQKIMEQNASNASILIHDQVAECPALSSVLPSSNVSHVWLEKGEMTDLSGIISSDRGLPVEKESSDSHHHADRLSQPTMELLMFVDTSVHGWRSDLLEDKNMGCGSSCPPLCEHTKGIISPNQNMPEYEGFVLETNEAHKHIPLDGIDLNKLGLPSNVLERASVLEQLCKSACTNTPISDFSSTYKLHHDQKLYRSLPDCVLGGMQLNPLGMSVPSEEIDADNSSLTKEIKCNAHEVALSELQPSSATQSAPVTKKLYMSPVRKVWDGIIMNSGSSEKRTSSATDLPCIPEESKSDEAFDTFEEGHALEISDVLVKRDPLADITGNSNLPTSVCENEEPYDRCSVASINMDPISFSKTNLRPQNYSNKGGLAQTEKEKQSASMGLSGIKRANNSLQQRVTEAKLSEKTGLRKGAHGTLEESKPSNIVSNVTSFIPLVHKRQAQPIVAATGKREVKVKALEAAEAAKRLAEKKEIERRMKKEALKLDREKKGEERRKNEVNMAAKRQREEEERRKHEADMAARKRQRVDDERKEKERKRKREEDERKERKRNCVEKPKKQDARTSEQKRPQEELRQSEKIGKVKGGKSLDRKPEDQHASTSKFTNDTSNASTVVKQKEHLDGYGDNRKVSVDHYEVTKISSSTPDIKRDPSYDISPYKCSDDEVEEDEEDDKPNYKFVPEWANRSAVALILSSQKRIDPESVFPPGSFCKIDEVLMPRRLQKNTSNAVPR